MTTWFNKYNLINKTVEDYSNTYTNSKNAFFYIGNVDLSSWKGDISGAPLNVVSFKPFLKTFSIKMDAELSPLTDDNITASPAQRYKGQKVTYTVSLQVPSFSAGEAKLNAQKISIFMTMLTPPHERECDALTPKQEFNLANKPYPNHGENVNEPPQNIFYVSYCNLIQSGQYTSARTIKTDNHLKEYGLQCEIFNIKTNIDVDMGFYEEGTSLLPKAYDVSFSLKPQDYLNQSSSKVHIRGFNKNGSFASIDIKSWPFGVRL